MVRFASALLALCTVHALASVAAPVAALSPLPAGWLGPDPEGDADLLVAPGVAVDDALDENASDLRGAAAASYGDFLMLRLYLTAPPPDRPGFLYHITFTHNGTDYALCHETSHPLVPYVSPVESDGCSRFVDEERVGERLAPYVVGPNEAGELSSVTWLVAADELAGPIREITGISADTWFRGASDCCAGSTEPQSYLWNRADLADSAPWAFTIVPAAPPPSMPAVLLSARPYELRLEPGNEGAFNLTIEFGSAPGPGVSYDFDLGVNAVDGFDFTLTPTNLTLGPDAMRGEARLVVDVPASTPAQRASLSVSACLAGAAAAEPDSCTLLALTVTVREPHADDEPAASPTTSAPADASTSATVLATRDATSTRAPSEDAPGPGVVVSLLLVAVLGALTRRSSRSR